MGFRENGLVLLEVGMRGRSGGRLVVEGFYDKEPLILKKLEMIRSLWALMGALHLGVMWFILHVISIALAR